MTRHNSVYSASGKVLRWMLSMALAVFVSVFSFGALSAQAAEGDSAVMADEGQAPMEEGVENNGGGAMILLMGGMLIIILAVVISVVGTFVSTAAIVDEL